MHSALKVRKASHFYQGDIGMYTGVVIPLCTYVELILNYLPPSSVILLNLQGGVNIKPLQLIFCQHLMLVWQMYGVYVLVHKCKFFALPLLGLFQDQLR